MLALISFAFDTIFDMYLFIFNSRSRHCSSGLHFHLSKGQVFRRLTINNSIDSLYYNEVKTQPQKTLGASLLYRASVKQSSITAVLFEKFRPSPPLKRRIGT